MAPAGMPFGAGPLYTDAIMGQTPSVAEREYARKVSSTILREDSIRIESEVSSRPDSWSIHCDCTDQAPYDMNTQTSLLRLPKQNPSHDLAQFLRTTGPSAPHRRPSKISDSSEVEVPAPRGAFRFLRSRQRRPVSPASSVELVDQPTQQPSRSSTPPLQDLQDVGGLLVPHVEQKVSTTGTRYFALKPRFDKDSQQQSDDAPTLSPSIVESRISISFPDSINSVEKLDVWPQDYEPYFPLQIPHNESAATFVDLYDAVTGASRESAAPIRPPASIPPTPEPVSAVSIADSYRSDLTEHPAKRSFDLARALSSHPLHAATSSSLPLPESSSVCGDSAVRRPAWDKDVTIEHPCPRRFASHTALLQRASSLGSSLYRRSFTESPGPPPPRSPLRPRRDAGTIEGILDSYERSDATPRSAPSIKDVYEYNNDVQSLRPVITTECTGPIKRPKSRGKNSITQSSYQFLRREREERTRARKLRDRPALINPSTSIDMIMNGAPEHVRQKLRKARPHIQIPNLCPPPQATRASSTASSEASWGKAAESTRTPVSAIPSETTQTTTGEKTGYTPISPTTSNGSAVAEANMALSPVMLIAEEIPVPKGKPTPKPATIVVKEGKPYSPRPRSASIPRSALKRRSRVGTRTPTRPRSPGPDPRQDDTPPLPLPPPNRALPLPPTPPASGSEKAVKSRSVRIAEVKKELPLLPTCEIAPNAHVLHTPSDHLPHIITQKKHTTSKEPARASRLQARLEVLEKQNALLSAALHAVLRTNGALNAPLSELGEESSTTIPMTWESRIARRSAASHTASSSNGSALEMYMTTRRGSK